MENPILEDVVKICGDDSTPVSASVDGLFGPEKCQWLWACAELSRRDDGSQDKRDATDAAERTLVGYATDKLCGDVASVARRILGCARLLRRLKQLPKKVNAAQQRSKKELAELAVSLLERPAREATPRIDANFLTALANGEWITYWTGENAVEAASRLLDDAWKLVEPQWHVPYRPRLDLPETKDETKKGWPLDWHEARPAFLRDVLRALGNHRSKSELDSAKQTVIEPFVVIPTNKRDPARILQFRFELVGGSQKEGQAFINPLQAWQTMDSDFSGMFDEVVSQVTELDCPHPLPGDIRVTIEEFAVRTTSNPTARSKLFFSKEHKLEGSSGTGAAARGMFFAFTGKAQDWGVITMVAVGRGGCSPVQIDSLPVKVRAVEATGAFDTIVVCGVASERTARKALRTHSDIWIENIERNAKDPHGRPPGVRESALFSPDNS